MGKYEGVTAARDGSGYSTPSGFSTLLLPGRAKVQRQAYFAMCARACALKKWIASPLIFARYQCEQRRCPSMSSGVRSHQFRLSYPPVSPLPLDCLLGLSTLVRLFFVDGSGAGGETASGAASPGNRKYREVCDQTLAERMPPWSTWAKRNTETVTSTARAAVISEPGCPASPAPMRSETKKSVMSGDSLKVSARATHPLSSWSVVVSDVRGCARNHVVEGCQKAIPPTASDSAAVSASMMLKQMSFLESKSTVPVVLPRCGPAPFRW